MLSDTTNLPAELASQIQAELKPGEKLIWAARPLPRLFHKQAILHASFGIVWLTFTFGFFAAVLLLVPRLHWLSLEFLAPLVIIGLPFTLIGCVALYSPFQIAKRARRTVYALTNHRAIVFSSGDAIGNVKMQVQSYGRDVLATLGRRERADGSGDLILEPLPKMRGTYIIWTPRHGFMAIENVQTVEALCRKTLGGNGVQHTTVFPDRFMKKPLSD